MRKIDLIYFDVTLRFNKYNPLKEAILGKDSHAPILDGPSPNFPLIGDGPTVRFIMYERHELLMIFYSSVLYWNKYHMNSKYIRLKLKIFFFPMVLDI